MTTNICREEAARALFIGANPETKLKTNTIMDELITLHANIQLFEKGTLGIFIFSLFSHFCRR
jgi:hypothetical protein